MMNITASLALISLVIQNTAVAILLKFSFRETAAAYAPTTVVLTTEMLKLLVCGLVAVLQSFGHFLSAILTIGDQSILFVPSMLYVIQNNLLFFGAQKLSPVIYIVCTQMKILSTAVISRFLLGTKLSPKQHLALFFLVFGVILVQAPDRAVFGSSHKQDKPDESLIGVSAVLLASITSGAAGVILEKIFKDPDDRAVKVEHTIWSRNVQLSLISLPFALVGVYYQASEQVRNHGLFHGYDAVVWSVVLLQAGGGIIIGYVMKFASTILKCFAVALSICLCAIYSVANGDVIPSATLLLGLLIVNAAIASYSMYPLKSKLSTSNDKI